MKGTAKAALIATALMSLSSGLGAAEYGPGASDAEIIVGNIVPYSGPLSLVSTIGKTQAAFFRMINEQGGINGRKIRYLSYDDAYSPPKTVEQARKLVENDDAAIVFATAGTPTNAAIAPYLNGKKVPQLFLSSGDSRFNDPERWPWTMAWFPQAELEGRLYAKYILAANPSAKIAILFQKDDFGKNIVKGLRDGLGPKADMIVAEAGYEPTDPTVDSQIALLRQSGADAFMNFSTPRTAAQAIRRIAETGWKPSIHILAFASISVGGVLKPAGLENSTGIVSANFLKDPTDPAWADDPGVKTWRAFMAKYYPEGDLSNAFFSSYAYSVAQSLVQVLKQSGDKLTRENIMDQARRLQMTRYDMLLPGIEVTTGPGDYSPIKQMRMMRFDGARWIYFGEILSGGK
ncbi:MAG TPA: ABC transporter substrate-binding protein [Rhodoblastus sp.]|nr:ABC transporter substrate-binding protein [Rhodoblastus sp.]